MNKTAKHAKLAMFSSLKFEKPGNYILYMNIYLYLHTHIFGRIPNYIIYLCQFCSCFANLKGLGVMKPPRKHEDVPCFSTDVKMRRNKNTNQ